MKSLIRQIVEESGIKVLEAKTGITSLHVTDIEQLITRLEQGIREKFLKLDTMELKEKCPICWLKMYQVRESLTGREDGL